MLYSVQRWSIQSDSVPFWAILCYSSVLYGLIATTPVLLSLHWGPKKGKQFSKNKIVINNKQFSAQICLTVGVLHSTLYQIWMPWMLWNWKFLIKQNVLSFYWFIFWFSPSLTPRSELTLICKTCFQRTHRLSLVLLKWINAIKGERIEFWNHTEWEKAFSDWYVVIQRKFILFLPKL